MVNRDEHIKIYSVTLIITFIISVSGYFVYHSFYNKSFLSHENDSPRAEFNMETEEEKAKIDELMNENNKLKEQLVEKENQLQQEIEKLKQDEINKQKELIAENMDKLMEAQKLFYSQQYIQCAQYLETIDVSMLGENSKELYNQLAYTAFLQAGEKLYFEGTNEFKVGNYQAAIEKLKKSFDYQKTQYYSDDALYFLAYAYYKNGEYEKASETALKLLQDYPDTTYRKEVNVLISSINNNQQQ